VGSVEINIEPTFIKEIVMLRHLKNVNELVVYASFSCGLAFVGRIFPAFFFPILLLRLGIFGYCLYVVAGAEKNRELAIILGGALFLGMLGGYWDLIEVYLRFDSERIISTFTAILCFVLFVIIIIFQIKTNEKTSKK
jgi:hypothetical protein